MFAVLNSLSTNIMVHMKTIKDSYEKARAINMNMCMADFIAPEHRFRSRYKNSAHGKSDENNDRGEQRTVPSDPPTPDLTPQTPGDVAESYPTSDPAAAGDTLQMLHEVEFDPDGSDVPITPGKEFSASTPPISATSVNHGLTPIGEEGRGRSAQRDIGSEASSEGSEEKGPTTEADHQGVFDRAVYLLRQALDLQQTGGGGVVLFDTNALSNSTQPGLRRTQSDHGSSDMDSRLKMPRSQNSSEIVPGSGIGASRSAHSGAMRERVVLAAASVNKPNGGAPTNFGRADTTYRVTLTPPELQRMCKKHPRGKLFHIPDNVGTSLFDWEGRSIMGRLSAKFYELVLLRRQFPQAKQVIFIPMFHANLNRWTSCFAFTNSRYRVFTYEMDYLPTLSFCNLIRSEIARLGRVFADQEKNDFIGSVSHELRSPLHGTYAVQDNKEKTTSITDVR